MEYWLILIIILIVIGVLSYLFKIFNFFERNGLPFYKPSYLIIGAIAPVLLRRTSFVKFIENIYYYNPETKYIGFYATTKRIILLRDTKLIQSVLVKNFNAFHDRPIFADFNEVIVTTNLFTLQGEKWRDIRKLLSPFFATKIIKDMFTLMSEYAIDFAEFMSTLQADKSNVNIKDFFDRYTNDIIVQCCYGIKINSVRNPADKFYISGKEITHMSVMHTIKYIFVRTFPTLGRIFDIKLLNSQAIKYFVASIKNEITTRYNEQITRPDLIQLMIDNKPNKIQLNMDDMIAQAYVFYFAGFETTSSIMSFITQKIVTNPNIQILLRQEIDTILNELNGNITYETITQLKYLDVVVKEALRLYSPSILERTCNEPFELPPALPGKKPFIVNKGMTIWIPVNAIHHDEKYYDNPEEFRPERFLNQNSSVSFYSPFGLGPKMCIGKRLGILMIKVVLFHLLARCELKHCAKTKSVTFSKKHLLMIPEDGFWLNVQQREICTLH